MFRIKKKRKIKNIIQENNIEIFVIYDSAHGGVGRLASSVGKPMTEPDETRTHDHMLFACICSTIELPFKRVSPL